MCRSRGGGDRGKDPPFTLKKHKAYGYLSNTGPDTLENHRKATKPAFNVRLLSARPTDAI